MGNSDQSEGVTTMEGVVDGEVAMTTRDGEEEEEEDEVYRCETCRRMFYSLSEFMDHRNFDCHTGTYL